MLVGIMGLFTSIVVEIIIINYLQLNILKIVFSSYFIVFSHVVYLKSPSLNMN